MRYANIDSFDVVNGIDVGISVYTQGCPHHCKNCFNPETWSFDDGNKWTRIEEDKVISLLSNPYIKRLTILGGEPLVTRNKSALCSLLEKVKKIYPNKRIWLYTGNLYDDIKEEYYDVIKYVDVIVDGEYIDELRDITLKFCGSSNQRIIDVQKSIEFNTVVLLNI